MHVQSVQGCTPAGAQFRWRTHGGSVRDGRTAACAHLWQGPHWANGQRCLSRVEHSRVCHVSCGVLLLCAAVHPVRCQSAAQSCAALCVECVCLCACVCVQHVAVRSVRYSARRSAVYTERVDGGERDNESVGGSER